MAVTVRGTDKDDPTPRGTLQLLSRTEALREGEIDGKGLVRLEKEGFEPGKYDLRLEFTPTDQEGWAKLEKPLPGPWRVVPTARVKVPLEEASPPGTTAQKYRDKVRFKLLEGKEEKIAALPRGKKYALAFRPGRLAIKGRSSRASTCWVHPPAGGGLAPLPGGLGRQEGPRRRRADPGGRLPHQ